MHDEIGSLAIDESLFSFNTERVVYLSRKHCYTGQIHGSTGASSYFDSAVQKCA